MATITLRSTKGSPLTNAEIDANFSNLNSGQTSGAAITGGTINGTTIGASTASTGKFTTVQLNAGSASAPTLYFVSGGSTTGFYSSTSNQVDFTANGVNIGHFNQFGLNNMIIGQGTAASGTFTSLTANGAVVIGASDTNTVTLNSQFVSGTRIKSAKSVGNTVGMAAYDTDGAAYTTLITLTAGTTPTLALTSTGVGSIDNMSIGATTQSTGKFTTLEATGSFTTGAAVSMAAGTANTTISASSGTITIGGATGTGALTFGTSTASQTTNIATGVTASGNTNTINIGSSGAAGSTTSITIGSTSGTSATGIKGSLSVTGLNTGGLVKAGATTGGLSIATAGTDYLAPPSGTSILKANSGGALANATAGTDYLAPPSGTSILKANSGGALANATAGTDYIAPYGSTTANSFLGSADGSASVPAFRTLVNGDLPASISKTNITASGSLIANGTFQVKSVPAAINAATYTVSATDSCLVFTTTACSVTLPSAATYTGRVLWFKTITATAVTSASSNVYPRTTAVLGTAICAATAGSWAMLVSDGTNWVTMNGA